jgi:hypothetical protein
MAGFDRPVPVERRKLCAAPLILTLRCLPPLQRYAPGQGKSAGYEGWLKAAAADLRAQAKGRLSGRVTISIGLEDRHPRRGAGDCIAPIVELLVITGVLPDAGAGFVRALHCAWAPITGVTIRIERAG